MINVRTWDMYKDKNLAKEGYIEDVYLMDIEEANKIIGKEILKTGSYYTLASAYRSGVTSSIYTVTSNGEIKVGSSEYDYSCYGIRPIIEMLEGVYILSGIGTEEEPYVLGIDR